MSELKEIESKLAAAKANLAYQDAMDDGMASNWDNCHKARADVAYWESILESAPKTKGKENK